MLNLVIGNKAYSSWSLRGWLACKQSGLPFSEEVVSLYDAEWERLRETAAFAPSAGKVPLLRDGDIVVWDSLAILDYLVDKVGPERFWPVDAAARGFARSIVAEMHAGFPALRRTYTMNTRRRLPAAPVPDDVAIEIARIVDLWGQARGRWGESGPFLFGQFGAADIAFAPVVTRVATYSLPVPDFAQDYCAAMLAHPFMVEWLAAASAEPQTIAKFEPSAP